MGHGLYNDQADCGSVINTVCESGVEHHKPYRMMYCNALRQAPPPPSSTTEAESTGVLDRDRPTLSSTLHSSE